MMNAIRMLDQPMLAEAMAYCDRLDIREPEDCERVRLSMCHREFMRAIEPFQQILVRATLFSLETPRYIVYPDGHFERAEEPRSPQLQELIDQVNTMIACEAQKYGFTWPVGELPQQSRKELASSS